MHLQSVAESEVCSYLVTVCTNVLCRPDEAEDSPTSLSALVEPILDRCLTRPEDWWTYEICFDKGVKQFHVGFSTTINDKGVSEQRPQIEAGI